MCPPEWTVPLSWHPCPSCGGLDTHRDDCPELVAPVEYPSDHDD